MNGPRWAQAVAILQQCQRKAPEAEKGKWGEMLGKMRMVTEADLEIAVLEEGEGEGLLSYLRTVLAEKPGAGSAAGAEDTGPGPARHPKLPSGTVLAIQEVLTNGTKRTCGTLTVISRTGLAVTACHCVVWEDGCIHPARLCILGQDDIQVQHLRSFPDLDITVLQLIRPAQPPAEELPEDSGAKQHGSPSSSSSGASTSSASTPWPWLPVAREEPTGANVVLYGFAAAAEQEGLLSAAQPSAIHGKVSHYSAARSVGVADYQGFPNMSGGPVVFDGEYLGTHTCGVTHSGPPEEPLPPITERTEGDDIVAKDMPAAPSPAAAAATPGAAPKMATPGTPPRTTLTQRVAVCEAQLQQMQLAEGCNAQLGLFVPVATILARLEGCNVLPLDWEQKQLQSAAKRARHQR